MAFLNEVGGKLNSKTYMIGDGVDKVHAPMQVPAQMATDLMNLSSSLYPSLSVRNGRTKISDGLLSLTGIVGGPYYIGTSKPFMDSAGNIHYCIQYVNEGTSPDTIILAYYVLYPGENFPILSHIITIDATKYVFGLPSDRYLSLNFAEYDGKVYMFHKKTISAINSLAYTQYIIATRNIETVSILASTTDEIACPCCTYVGKMYFADNRKIYWSATGDPLDFTTAMDSGFTELTQGGRITALIPMSDRIFIGTEKAVFVLYGNSYESISVSLLADNIGVLSPKCVVQQNGIVYFGASDGDVYQYNSSSLINITREPIQTGSKSYVAGGFPENSFKITSIAIQKNILYCVDDRRVVNTTYKNIYTFDLAKKRWYEEDYPYLIDMLYTWNTIFSDGTSAYYVVVNTWFLESAQQIDHWIYSVDNELSYSPEYLVNVAGTKQKVSNTATASDPSTLITASGSVKITINTNYSGIAEGLDAMILYAPVLIGDSMATVATKIAAFLNAQITTPTSSWPWLPLLFTFTSSGPIIYMEAKYMFGNAILIFKIENGDCTGLTATNKTAITTGTLNTYHYVNTSTPIPFLWISPAYQLSASGKQMLKSVHFSYYAPNGTEISLYTSNTIDQDDFVMIKTLPPSALKQANRFTLPVSMNIRNNWLRIKIAGTGNVIVYNMTLDWRLTEKVR